MYSCRYEKMIVSPYEEQEVKDILSRTPWDTLVPDLCCVDRDGLSLEMKSRGVLAPHSFQPQISLILKETESGTEIHVKVQPKMPVRILVYIITMFASLFEVILLMMTLMSELEYLPALFVPLGITAFLQILSYCGLRLSAKPFMQILEKMLNP